MDFGADLASPFGVKPRGDNVVAPWVRGPGSWTFTAPADGLYTFRLWGSGYFGNYDPEGVYVYGGAAGGMTVATERLSKGKSIAITVGFGPKDGSSTIVDTTAVLPTRIITATAARGFTTNPGTGINGDLNYTGGVGGSSSTQPTAGGGPNPGTAPTNYNSSAPSGGSAPGDAVLRGGDGGKFGSSQIIGGWPGGGGASIYVNVFSAAGAAGGAVVTYEGA